MKKATAVVTNADKSDDKAINNAYMKIIIFTFLFLFTFFITQLNAQDSLSANNHRFSLKVSGAFVNGMSIMDGIQVLFVQQKPQLGLSINYQFMKNFNTGLSIAHVKGGRAIPNAYNGSGISYSIINSSVWYYGLSFSYDLLPVIFNTNRIRFDVYPIISANYVCENWINQDFGTPSTATFLEYIGGIGIGYNFNKHVGVFTESLLGKFYNYDKFQLKVGLKYKF